MTTLRRFLTEPLFPPWVVLLLAVLLMVPWWASILIVVAIMLWAMMPRGRAPSVAFDEAALVVAGEVMRDEVDRYVRLGRPVSGRKVIRAAQATTRPPPRPGGNAEGLPPRWLRKKWRHERREGR